MDIELIRTVFKQISGEEDVSGFFELIDLAISETLSIVRPDVNIEDMRLSYLAAAIANYRLQQMYAARERSAVTYAGKLPKESQNTACKYAEAIVKDYMKICRSLLRVSDFVFSAFSGSGEEIK